MIPQAAYTTAANFSEEGYVRSKVPLGARYLSAISVLHPNISQERVARLFRGHSGGRSVPRVNDRVVRKRPDVFAHRFQQLGEGAAPQVGAPHRSLEDQVAAEDPRTGYERHRTLGVPRGRNNPDLGAGQVEHAVRLQVIDAAP